jgi:hypothetical protein
MIRDGPPYWGLSKGLTTPHCKENSLLQNVTHGLRFGWILWNDLGRTSDSGYGTVVGSCEHGNKPLGSIKDREFPD